MSDSSSGDIDDGISGAWTTVKSAFSWTGGALRGGSTKKTVAGAGLTAGSMAITGAQLGTGTSSLAVGGAIAAGVAVSATGLGLVIVGGILTLASVATSGTSMVKSAAHVIGLKKILREPAKFAACKCEAASVPADMANDHQWIATKVLPYIISQKTEKAVKKGVGVVPGAGILTNLYRLGRFAFKADRGKKRGFYAQVLTRHLITHDCALAGAVVAELFSAQEMLTLRQFDSDQSGPLIASKMKSV